MKKGRLAALALCLAAALGGCAGEKEPDRESETQKERIVVGFSQLGSESEWRTANTKSVEAAFTPENGYTLVFENGRQKQENQIKAVRSFILQEVDYILLAPVQEAGWESVLEEAKEAGIPVILVDRMADVEDEDLYTAWVGSDFRREGLTAGRWLEDFLEENHEAEEEIRIVMLQGTLGSSAQLGRTGGFEEIAAAHENWSILARETGDFTAAKGKEVMESFLEQFPEIDVLVCENDDMAFGAIDAIQEAGRTCGVDGEITVISFDAVEEAFDLMEQGLINVDVECNPDQGPLLAQIIERLEAGEPVEKRYYVEEGFFTADTAAAAREGRTY